MSSSDKKMISAVVLRRPHDLRLTEIPEFDLSEDQVMIEVAACGVCGSDLRYYQGENPWALHTLGVSLPNPPNIVLGHEFAGKVVDAGGMPELLGKRVAVLSFKTCERCADCRRGRENLCRQTTHLGHGAGWGERAYYPGGMAERCPAWGKLCFEIPDGMSYEEGALLDVVGVGVHAARVGGVGPGSSVAVLGVGPIGNAILQAARAMGASRTYGIDTYEVALDIARACGATLALNASKTNPVAAIRESNRGNCSVVFDTVGTTETLRKCVSLLEVGGTLVNMAVHDTELFLNALDLGSERTVRTSCNFLPEEYPLALALVAGGQIDVKPWITHRYPLQEIEHGFEVALHKEDHRSFKVIINP
ncbi:MAG: 2,3-butanediol dehydrogenase [Candidatus Abyssubacteria bacterium]